MFILLLILIHENYYNTDRTLLSKMRINALHTGTQYEKLCTDNYIKHVTLINTINEKTPHKPIKLKSSHSANNLHGQQSSIFSTKKLYQKLLKMSPSKKENSVINLQDLSYGQRLLRNKEIVRKRTLVQIKSLNVSLARRMNERSLYNNSFSILFRNDDSRIKRKKSGKESKRKKSIQNPKKSPKLPTIRYPRCTEY